MRLNLRYRSFFTVGFCAFVLGLVQPASALVISEVMYHPVETDDTEVEFIELYNDRAVFEDLSGFQFVDGIEFEFPEDTVLGAKQYIVVALDPNAVEAMYGISGVLGPFDGRLDNDGEDIELANEVGEIILQFRYNDGHPWPVAADGTGHSMVLANKGGDPEEASTWAASTFIGGTPGGPDEIQVEPPDPTQVTLVDIGDAGRYFKGTEEPSPGLGGVATTDWTKIGFNDNPSNTDWIDGDNGYGYSNESSELQYIRTFLDDMAGGYISIYARLAFTVTNEEINSFSQLRAEVHFDDDYVLYLNGTRVSATDGITGDPPAFDAVRGGGWDPGPDNIDLTGYLNLLVPGENILAIQAHNGSISNSSDALAAPVLKATVEEAGGADDVRTNLVINEVLANSDADPGTDWIELYNPGPIAIDLSNVYLSDDRADLLQYKIADGTVLGVGEFLAIREGTGQDDLPFALNSAGETVYVTAADDSLVPQAIRVLDAVRYGATPPDVTVGRYPNGSDSIEFLSSATFGASNSKPLVHDIVINEIMYHHGTRDDRYDYVELYNKGTSMVSLTGWSFTDGIEYDFTQPVVLSPDSYVVVAKDPNLLESVYDNLTKNVNLFGPYSGNLNNHSERIQLSYPMQEWDADTGQLETYWVVADEVTYYDGGRWPKWADGKGASMELRDPFSNNNSPGAWADSDEWDKSSWEQFSFTINSNDNTYTHDTVDVFGLMLLNQGEVLIDDLEVIINGSNRVNNGGFEGGLNSWRTLGNHVQTFSTTEDSRSGSRSLHLVATGHGDPGANRVNQSIAGVTAGTVTFRGWARWLRGTRYMLLRTSRERSPVQPPRPAHAFELDMPLNQGTPGLPNTALVANRGPDITEVKHEPVLPAGNQPIVVSARVADNDGVGGVTLHYRSEGAASFDTTTMVDDGVGSDVAAGDGIYTGVIPGASGGTMRAFYITASDGSAAARFPTRLPASADVPDRTCLVRVGDAQVSTEFATYRIWMSDDVINVFRNRPNLANELMDCTFVYDDKEVFYNAKIRHRGSPFLRSGFGRDPRGRTAYRIEFNPDKKFRDREEINLDNTEGSNRGPLQERMSYWFYRKMGLQFSTQEYVRVINCGNSHANYEDVQKIDGDYIDKWWPDDDDGYIHKVDDYFEYTAEGTGHRNYDEGLKYDGSHPLIPETYRWGFEKRGHRENDKWDHLFDFAVAMNSGGANYEQQIESVIHPEHFAAVLAIRHAVGDWDSYGYNRGKNNYFYYASKEGKWYLLPWDIDFTLGSGHGPSTDIFTVNSGKFPEVARFLSYPKYRQMYLRALSQLVYGPWQTSYGTANPPTEFDRFLDDAADALARNGFDDSRRDGIKNFVQARRNYLLGIVPAITFGISTNNGRPLCVASPTVTIEGTRQAEVLDLWANVDIVSFSLTGEHTWEAELSVPLGTTLVVLRGMDDSGGFVDDAAGAISVTRVTKPAISSVRPKVGCNSGFLDMKLTGADFAPGSDISVMLTMPSEEVGFDAMYVQNNQAFDQIDAASLLLDHPETGQSDPVYAVHEHINLFNTGDRGVFLSNEETFAAPYNGDITNVAVRFTGYIYAPSPGERYFGVNSDDGFVLHIDGRLVGEYAEARGPATTDVMGNRTAGTMTFDFQAAGGYFLQLDYFENGGGEEIEFFQTNSIGGDRRLINVDSELIVLRASATRITGTDIVIPDSETLRFVADLSGIEPGMWNVVVEAGCGKAGQAVVENAFETVACESDINADARIDFADVADVAGRWIDNCSSPDWCGNSDIDRSGRVDLADLAIIADEWFIGVQ